jgi:SHS family lactate transporter-like MFS transporter
LSERLGRRHAIIVTAVLSLFVLPRWALSTSAVWLAVGASVDAGDGSRRPGASSRVHLNELSPADARGTSPGFTYQLGNLIASVNATLQAGIAVHYDHNYVLALALVAGVVAVVIVILAAIGVEAKGVAFGRAAELDAGPSVSPV